MTISTIRKFVFQLLPLLILGIAWQIAATIDARFNFLFASPSTIASALVRGAHDTLLSDTATTAAEIISGLALGSIVGVIAGVAIGLEKRAASILEPYLIVIASIPIFAIAPMTIIWFGTEYFSKVMLVFLSTVFLARIMQPMLADVA